MFVVVTVVFVVSRAVGDPITIAAPPTATRAEIASLKAAAGLNDPLLVQYGRFLRDVAQLNFGTSFRTQQPARDEIRARIPTTAELAACGLAVAIAVGIPIGIVAAVLRDSPADYLARLLALVGQATPSFWLGLMLIYFFGVELGWLPTGGTGSWKHLVLPAVTLGMASMAAVMRLTRAGMLDVLQTDFIRTARAKGLREHTVIGRHALRHALLPVVTIMGLQVGRLFAGAILIETVFAWPGLGRLMITSIQSSDYPVVQAGVIFIAGAIVFANLAVDLIYRLIDPRIRDEAGR